MPYYFMRDTPLQALEQLMMSQPGQKPRGGGIYRSPFHYTPKDVACEYCQNYVRKHPCRLCECTCLEERIEAGVLELNEFVRDCFAPSMGPQFRKRMHMYLRDRADSEGKCWPGIKTIAADMRLSRSTVKRALTDLEQHGYLQKIPRYRDNGSSTSNLYSVQ